MDGYQQEDEGRSSKLKRRLEDYKRVLRIAIKPSKGEFIKTTKICLGGMFLIGLVGFGIFVAFKLAGL